MTYLLNGTVKSVAEIDDGLFNVYFQSGDQQQWVEVTLSENNII